MSQFSILVIVIAAVCIIDNFILGLFLTIRDCNKNKYEYLRRKDKEGNDLR